MKKLKPCPFCEAEAKMKFIGNEHTKSRTIEVKCSNSECRVTMKNGAIRFGFDWLEDISIKAWNRRAKLKPREVLIERNER